MPAMNDERTATKGTAKLRAWLRKKITPDPPLKLEIVKDIDETHCRVGREPKKDWHITFAEDGPPETINSRNKSDPAIDKFLQRSHVVLAAANRDLDCICQRTIIADQFIQSASQSVSKAEQTIRKALEKREAAISDLRRASYDPSFDGAHGSDASSCSQYQHHALSPGLTMSSESSSARSSVITLPPKGDDEDTKALQRLLLRKIDARMVGAFDEIDQVVGWLRIVKEVVRGVKRRTYV